MNWGGGITEEQGTSYAGELKQAAVSLEVVKLVLEGSI